MVSKSETFHFIYLLQTVSKYDLPVFATYWRIRTRFNFVRLLVEGRLVMLSRSINLWLNS
jgi:hypothetical protein